MNIELPTTQQTIEAFKRLGAANLLRPAWQPDMPISDEVKRAMAELAREVAAESEAEAMLPWFLTEQTY